MGQGFIAVVLPRFELGQTGPESVVLPLHHSTMSKIKSIIRFCGCKGSYFSLFSKYFSTIFIESIPLTSGHSLPATYSIYSPLIKLCPPILPCYVKKPFSTSREKRFFMLYYQDSNLDIQDQNLLCYHYTIVQYKEQLMFPLICGCKGSHFSLFSKHFPIIFIK